MTCNGLNDIILYKLCILAICTFDIIGADIDMKKINSCFVKRIVAICSVAATFCHTAAFASILGTESGGWQTDMGGGAVYSNNVFISDSVGRQTENYVEYTPNSQSVPVVVNGSSVYGSRTISSAAKYMEDNNLRPLIGINGDYFSPKTGIPMGYTIVDGKILSKESGIQDAVGFRKDGTGFIDKIGVDTTLEHDGNSINILYVNKWPQKGFSWVYMLDSSFSDTTKTNFNALYVICSATKGDLSLNTSMTLNVDEVFIYDGAIKIPDGKYVFVMDPDGDKTMFDFLSNLAEGDTLTFRNSVYGAERHDWTEAKYAISSIGGRLINNSVIGSGFEAGASPRTAVGIKENGNIIFYTIDGRQNGYSYGVQIKTLANRMSELGCVDAINLDGGGSTAIGGIFPGSESFVITNKPSDGSERRCANYLFLQDLREQTGIVWYVDWNERDNHNYLSGTSYQLEAKKIYDTGNYKMDSLDGIEFSIENIDGATAEIDSDGLITFNGSGKVLVHATGEQYSKTFSFETFGTPDEVRIVNQATGETIEELTVKKGGMVNYSLEAGAFVNGIRLESDPSLFSWEASGSNIQIDQDGNISIKDDGTQDAVLRVTAAGVAKEIPINVVEDSAFSDIHTHWAKDTIEKMAKKGIINGFYENGAALFKPDGNITRVQFAAIVSRSLGLDLGDFSSVSISFSDNDKIAPWAEDYVKAMVSLGYITGRSDDGGKTVFFAPDDSITRAEAFTVIARVLDTHDSATLNYADNSDIPEWAKDAFSSLSALDIIQGFEDNTIRPHKLMSRAEAAVLIDKSGI